MPRWGSEDHRAKLCLARCGHASRPTELVGKCMEEQQTRASVGLPRTSGEAAPGKVRTCLGTYEARGELMEEQQARASVRLRTTSGEAVPGRVRTCLKAHGAGAINPKP